MKKAMWGGSPFWRCWPRRPAVFEKMHINASDGLTGPKVQYIAVYGKDLQAGEKRREKMVPKRPPL